MTTHQSTTRVCVHHAELVPMSWAFRSPPLMFYKLWFLNMRADKVYFSHKRLWNCFPNHSHISLWIVPNLNWLFIAWDIPWLSRHCFYHSHIILILIPATAGLIHSLPRDSGMSSNFYVSTLRLQLDTTPSSLWLFFYWTRRVAGCEMQVGQWYVRTLHAVGRKGHLTPELWGMWAGERHSATITTGPHIYWVLGCSKNFFIKAKILNLHPGVGLCEDHLTFSDLSFPISEVGITILELRGAAVSRMS